MEDSKRDYKSAVTDKPVSVRKLQNLMHIAASDLSIAKSSLEAVERELTAIIEEIGEEW